MSKRPIEEVVAEYLLTEGDARLLPEIGARADEVRRIWRGPGLEVVVEQLKEGLESADDRNQAVRVYRLLAALAARVAAKQQPDRSPPPKRDAEIAKLVHELITLRDGSVPGPSQERFVGPTDAATAPDPFDLDLWLARCRDDASPPSEWVVERVLAQALHESGEADTTPRLDWYRKWAEAELKPLEWYDGVRAVAVHVDQLDRLAYAATSEPTPVRIALSANAARDDEHRIVARADIVEQIQAWLRSPPRMADLLLDWYVAMARQRPLLFDYFKVDSVSDDRLTLRPDPSCPRGKLPIARIRERWELAGAVVPPKEVNEPEVDRQVRLEVTRLPPLATPTTDDLAAALASGRLPSGLDGSDPDRFVSGLTPESDARLREALASIGRDVRLSLDRAAWQRLLALAEQRCLVEPALVEPMIASCIGAWPLDEEEQRRATALVRYLIVEKRAKLLYSSIVDDLMCRFEERLDDASLPIEIRAPLLPIVCLVPRAVYLRDPKSVLSALDRVGELCLGADPRKGQEWKSRLEQVQRLVESEYDSSLSLAGVIERAGRLAPDLLEFWVDPATELVTLTMVGRDYVLCDVSRERKILRDAKRRAAKAADEERSSEILADAQRKAATLVKLDYLLVDGAIDRRRPRYERLLALAARAGVDDGNRGALLGLPRPKLMFTSKGTPVPVAPVSMAQLRLPGTV